jgi:hypothetical protein
MTRRRKIVVEVLDPWSFETSRRFWEGLMELNQCQPSTKTTTCTSRTPSKTSQNTMPATVKLSPTARTRAPKATANMSAFGTSTRNRRNPLTGFSEVTVRPRESNVGFRHVMNSRFGSSNIAKSLYRPPDPLGDGQVTRM